MKKLLLIISLFIGIHYSYAQVKDTSMVKPFDELPDEHEGDTIDAYVETVPEFEGGIDMMYLFISKRIKYPKEARRKRITGKVISQFIINEDGTMSDISIVKTDCECFNEEVIRVLKLMPPWKPGKQNGIPVRVKYELPVRFNLD